MTGPFRGATVAVLIVLTASTAGAARSQLASSPPTALASNRAASAPAAPAQKSPARQPSIAILVPKAGSTLHGRTIRVSVLVKGFNPLHEQFRSPMAREGHVHFYLDVERLPTTHTYPSPVPYRSISGTSYTWTGITPGRHTVAVQLVGNDHVPLRPPATDRVAITVPLVARSR